MRHAPSWNGIVILILTIIILAMILWAAYGYGGATVPALPVNLTA